jgi:hypothetical protein
MEKKLYNLLLSERIKKIHSFSETTKIVLIVMGLLCGTAICLMKSDYGKCNCI